MSRGPHQRGIMTTVEWQRVNIFARKEKERARVHNVCKEIIASNVQQRLMDEDDGHIFGDGGAW